MEFNPPDTSGEEDQLVFIVYDPDQEYQTFLREQIGEDLIMVDVPKPPLSEEGAPLFPPDAFTVPEKYRDLRKVALVNWDSLPNEKGLVEVLATIEQECIMWGVKYGDRMKLKSVDPAREVERDDTRRIAPISTRKACTAIELALYDRFSGTIEFDFEQPKQVVIEGILDDIVAVGGDLTAYLRNHRNRLPRGFTMEKLRKLMVDFRLKIYLNTTAQRDVHSDLITQIFSRDFFEGLDETAFVSEDTLSDQIKRDLFEFRNPERDPTYEFCLNEPELLRGAAHLKSTGLYLREMLVDGERKLIVDVDSLTLRNSGERTRDIAFSLIVEDDIRKEVLLHDGRADEIERKLGGIAQKKMERYVDETRGLGHPKYAKRTEREISAAHALKNRAFQVECGPFRSCVKVLTLKGLDEGAKKRKVAEFKHELNALRGLRRLGLTDVEEFDTYEDKYFKIIIMKWMGRKDEFKRLSAINRTMRDLVMDANGGIDPGDDIVDDLPGQLAYLSRIGELASEKGYAEAIEAITVTENEGMQYRTAFISALGSQEEFRELCGQSKTLTELVLDTDGDVKSGDALMGLREEMVAEIRRLGIIGGSYASLLKKLHKLKKDRLKKLVETVGEIQGVGPMGITTEVEKSAEDYKLRVDKSLDACNRAVEALTEHYGLDSLWQRNLPDPQSARPGAEIHVNAWKTTKKKCKLGLEHLIISYCKMVTTFYKDFVMTNTFDKPIDFGNPRRSPWPFDLANLFAIGKFLSWDEIESLLPLYYKKQTKKTEEYNHKLNAFFNNPAGLWMSELEHDIEKGTPFSVLADELEAIKTYIGSHYPQAAEAGHGNDDIAEDYESRLRAKREIRKIKKSIEKAIDDPDPQDAYSSLLQVIRDDPEKRGIVFEYLASVFSYIHELKSTKKIIEVDGQEEDEIRDHLASQFYASHPYRMGVVLTVYWKEIADDVTLLTSPEKDDRWDNMMSVMKNWVQGVNKLQERYVGSDVEKEGLTDEDKPNKKFNAVQVNRIATSVNHIYTVFSELDRVRYARRTE